MRRGSRSPRRPTPPPRRRRTPPRQPRRCRRCASAEADARTSLERHRVAQEQIAAEEERARAALADAARRLGQLRQDLAHAEQLRRDAEAAEQRLATEDSSWPRRMQATPRGRRQPRKQPTQAAEAVRVAEAEANRATEAAAEANARAQALAQLLAQAEQRWRRLDEQFARLAEERDRIRSPGDRARVGRSRRAEQMRAEARWRRPGRSGAAEQARAAAMQALAAAREGQSAAESMRAKLAAEAQALAEVLAVKDGERWPPMVDALSVPAGLETALGAALGEELTSAADRDAARHWRELPPFDPPPALPVGVSSLAGLVQGPSALARALSQIGLVEDETAGEASQAELCAGPDAGLPGGRGLALGRLHDPRRHPHGRGGPAATAQPAVGAAT